ncbi:MAG: 50S ribosomal protein L4 [Candidatus Omnitrophica bacterium]|nr:50S ribosomal protein L4 [Candidatus Omnitrophota bacterium]MBU1853562.1 50S ribosomal protein L4 [Candidatus Omnitrophota bacterium]
MKKRAKNKTTKKIDVPVLDVYSLSGKKVDKFKLDPDVFSSHINKPLLHQLIVMYRANQRQGTASTKKRGEVRGGGKKPWRQKGTGRARAGSIRSPLWRGGGVVFGPQPRDFGYEFPKKMKRLAIMSGLSAKTKDKEVMVIEKDPEVSQPKTSQIAKLLRALKVYNKRILFIYPKRNDNLIRSCRNIENLSLRLSDDFNVYDILSNTRILFSRETHDAIVKRLK